MPRINGPITFREITQGDHTDLVKLHMERQALKRAMRRAYYPGYLASRLRTVTDDINHIAARYGA